MVYNAVKMISLLMNKERYELPNLKKSVLRPVRVWMSNINLVVINCFVVNLVLAK